MFKISTVSDNPSNTIVSTVRDRLLANQLFPILLQLRNHSELSETLSPVKVRPITIVT
jgi:hypothetical protein